MRERGPVCTDGATGEPRQAVRDFDILPGWKKVTTAAYDPAYDSNREPYASATTSIRFSHYFYVFLACSAWFVGSAHGSPERCLDQLHGSAVCSDPTRPVDRAGEIFLNTPQHPRWRTTNGITKLTYSEYSSVGIWWLWFCSTRVVWQDVSSDFDGVHS